MTNQASPLFPAIEPYRTGELQVGDGHTLYWEECGNPNGCPVLFLHGGPGGGCAPAHRRFFDPAFYRIVLFDQRGAGRSTPLGEFRNNTTPLLVADIEAIRTMLQIDQWLVFGGSWGSTLALAYGEAHPSACLGFVLRGIFLCTKPEVDWFIHGIKNFYPEAYAEFEATIPLDERDDLMAAYAKRLFSDDPALYLPAARSWSRYECSCSNLEPPTDFPQTDEFDVPLARMEAHYMMHDGFLEDDQLIRNVDRIRHLPAVIVQGRYDVVCPPVSAYRLHEAWPEAAFHMVQRSGHAALEPDTAVKLVAATEQFKLFGKFA